MEKGNDLEVLKMVKIMRKNYGKIAQIMEKYWPPYLDIIVNNIWLSNGS